MLVSAVTSLTNPATRLSFRYR